jgi:hypothetical protein
MREPGNDLVTSALLDILHVSGTIILPVRERRSRRPRVSNFFLVYGDSELNSYLTIHTHSPNKLLEQSRMYSEMQAWSMYILFLQSDKERDPKKY